MPRSRIRFTLPALLIALIAFPASPAWAAVTCAYNGTTFELEIIYGSAADNEVIVSVSAGDIEVATFGGPVACTGDPATTANTESISITDTFGGDNTVFLNPGLAPGMTDESPGLSEIEVAIDTGTGSDQLFVSLAGGSNARLGAGGINLNAGAEPDPQDDADITLTSVENVQVIGTLQGEVIDASGGAGTGAAYPTPLDIRASGGDDMITGGDGDDFIEPGAGDDTVDGGGAPNEVNFGGGPMIVDLNAGTATGDGSDVLANVANLRMPLGVHDDVVIGNAADNAVIGRDGDDVFVPGGGTDNFNGGAGSDTIWTRDAPGAVTIDLGGQAVTGARTVNLNAVENAIGGPFDDTILGDGGANVLAGGPGDDGMDGAGGDDLADYAGNPTRIVANMRTGKVRGASVDTLANIEGVRGSPSDDIFISKPGTSDSFDGGPGSDTLRFAGTPGAVTADLRTGEAEDGGGATDVFLRLENLVGGSKRDTLRGSARRNRLSGGGGGDVIIARGGNDTAVGGRGGDTLKGGARNDILTGGAGNDDLFGGSGNDRCRQGAGSGIVRGCER